MGTSVEQIDRTYAHMLPDSEGYLRSSLDGYDTVTTASAATVAVRTAPSLTRTEKPPEDTKSTG
jgi:hypothetical protein